MLTLIPEQPRLNLIKKFPDGKWRVIYHQSGTEWLIPNDSRPQEMSWGKWERLRAIVLPLDNPHKKAKKVISNEDGI